MPPKTPERKAPVPVRTNPRNKIARRTLKPRHKHLGLKMDSLSEVFDSRQRRSAIQRWMKGAPANKT